MGDVVKAKSGWSPSEFKIDRYQGILFIKVDDLNNSQREQDTSKWHVYENRNYPKIKKLSTIFPKRGAAILTNKVRILSQDCYMDTNIMALEPEKIEPDFLYSFIEQTGLFKIADTSTIPQINNKHINPYKLWIPYYSEQKKIANLLKIVDNIITLQQRKLEYFMTIKAELLRSIFPNTVGKRGLHISDQPWKLQTMNDIFKEKNIKNEHGKLLSVSISKGIYPFSENERKNNSSNNKSNYKEVKYNDIAYNSMRMWQGALGVSKYDGIVSPAYTVITAKKQENPLFYYYYFKNKRMLFNFRQHSQGLTSDTWNLKFPLFKKIIIQTPISKKEEQIIANLFKTLDQNIIYTKTKIEKFNYIKQFLLQNMFI